MRATLRCLLGIMITLTLGGCAAGSRFGRACDDVLTVRVTQNGATTEVHPHVQEIFDACCDQPVLKQQYPPNLGSGWNDVTGNYYLTIPYGQGGANYWLVTHGNVVEAWYVYNGERRDINRGSWVFWVDNSGDGGQHELIIGWRYAGQVDVRTWTLSVQNNSIR